MKKETVVIEVKASTSGSVTSVCVEIGSVVNPGDELVIVESMKMEIPVFAEEPGRVAEILVGAGASVDANSVLIRLEAQ